MGGDRKGKAAGRDGGCIASWLSRLPKAVAQDNNGQMSAFGWVNYHASQVQVSI